MQEDKRQRDLKSNQKKWIVFNDVYLVSKQKQ